MRVEDEYQDLLQNMELAVATVYREQPLMSDYDVIRTYEALIDHYSAEKIPRQPKNFLLSALELGLFDAVRQICGWRSGRIELQVGGAHGQTNRVETIAVAVIIRCLKRLLKSARRWNRDGGRKGYPEFMSQYVG